MLPGLHPNGKAESTSLSPPRNWKHNPFYPYGEGGVSLRNECVLLAQGGGFPCPGRVGGLQGVSSYKGRSGDGRGRASSNSSSIAPAPGWAAAKGTIVQWPSAESWCLVLEKRPEVDRGRVRRHWFRSRLDSYFQAQKKKLPGCTARARDILSLRLHRVWCFHPQPPGTLPISSLSYRDRKPEKTYFPLNFHQAMVYISPARGTWKQFGRCREGKSTILFQKQQAGAEAVAKRRFQENGASGKMALPGKRHFRENTSLLSSQGWL